MLGEFGHRWATEWLSPTERHCIHYKPKDDWRAEWQFESSALPSCLSRHRLTNGTIHRDDAKVVDRGQQVEGGKNGLQSGIAQARQARGEQRREREREQTAVSVLNESKKVMLQIKDGAVKKTISKRQEVEDGATGTRATRWPG